MFILKSFPLPPTSNQLYTPITGKPFKLPNGKTKITSRLIKSIEGRKYDNLVQIYRIKAFRILDQIKAAFQPDEMLHVETIFVFSKNRVVGVKGKLKRLDASNRIKQLHDGLSTILEIDDSRFVSGTFSKATCEKESEEQVIIIITKSELKTLDQVRAALTA